MTEEVVGRFHGIFLSMMVAEAGSNSQRNAERKGFRVAYTRTKCAPMLMPPKAGQKAGTLGSRILVTGEIHLCHLWSRA